MAKLEAAIRDAIARGARKQVRAVVTPLRRDIGRLRRKVVELDGTLASLRRSAAAWDRMALAAPPVPPVSQEESKAARLSPRLVRSLRKRLALSQTALARLVGVSAPAVAHWEAGNAAPTGQNRATLVALRKVGKREAKELLVRRENEKGARGARARGSTSRRRRRRKTGN